MDSQLEEVAENKIRLTVDVPREDVKHAVEHAASDLAESLKIPGFRKGKVPMPVLVARVGKERLYSEAVESHIGGWFMNAAARSRIRPVEQPEYGYDLPESEDEDWRFTATVSVQPKPEPADWTSLEVGAPQADVPEDLVEHELNVLRSSVAELAPVEDRPAQPGDTVLVDLVATGQEPQRDYVFELGAGRLVPELEEALVGLSPGETRDVEFERGEDGPGSVELTLKELNEKILPPLDDELARAASEFDTLDELRADIEGRLREQIEAEVEDLVRAGAVDALVAASRVDASGPLVDARARTLLNNLARSLARRGVSLETYLALSGDSPEALSARIRQEAAQSVARELVLEAVADKLDIQIPDEDVEALIREEAEAAGDDPEEIIQRMRDAGGFEDLREDLRLRAALDRVASEVRRIPLEQAQAREQIWTPEKEKPQTPTKLWTPGSKEHA
ncbi:MAG TPA: trigger factor [Gaiellaceae bacterium]|nr:trigger factor [Gaiellaceae bacterium]